MTPGQPREPEIEVVVDADGWPTESEATVRRAALAALAAGAGAADMPAEPVGVTVLLTDDARVRALNAAFRGREAATNVLSFPADGPASRRPGMPGEPRPLGDVALALETVAREARHEGRPLDHHVAHLVVHGILHLLGHDHDHDREADAMERTETAVLLSLGVPDPYRESVPADRTAR